MLFDYIKQIFTNDIILVALISVLVSQTLKAIVTLIINHNITFDRIIGDGGMPSTHSTVVSSVTVLTGLLYGFGSIQFGLAAVFAYIVMHDAKGVRWETGKQAALLNDIIQAFEEMGNSSISPTRRLEEFVGHSPLQVLAGFLLGIVIAILYFSCVLV